MAGDRLREPLGDGTARGRIVTKAWFRWLRDLRVPRVPVSEFLRDDQPVNTSLTEVHPVEVAGDHDARLAVDLRGPAGGTCGTRTTIMITAPGG